MKKYWVIFVSQISTQVLKIEIYQEIYQEIMIFIACDKMSEIHLNFSRCVNIDSIKLLGFFNTGVEIMHKSILVSVVEKFGLEDRMEILSFLNSQKKIKITKHKA